MPGNRLPRPLIHSLAIAPRSLFPQTQVLIFRAVDLEVVGRILRVVEVGNVQSALVRHMTTSREIRVLGNHLDLIQVV